MLVLFIFAHKNTPRSPLPVSGALKTDSFLLRQDPCKAGLMQQAKQGIRKADLMLLTHAGCAFKDPRGRFGISNSHPAAVREQARDKLMKSERCDTAKRSGLYAVFQPFVPMFSQFRTAALRSNRQCGAAALRTEGPLQIHPQPFGPENYLYRSTRRVRCS